MPQQRFNKLRKKYQKSRDKASDGIKASLAQWQNLVKISAIVKPEPHSPHSRLTLMAHYSEQDSVHPYVFHYIKALQSAGSDVMLISTANTLPDRDIATLNAQNVSVIVRKNIGYDFGSWRTAIDVYPEMIDHYDMLIFANDSVYGPFHPLADTLKHITDRRFDLWSLTASNERREHLQSYFWGIGRQGRDTGFFNYFWKDYYRYYSRRQTVIERFELQFGALAQTKFNLTTGALWDEAALIARFPRKTCCPKNRINPLRDYWCELVTELQFPFVKRELFKTLTTDSHEFISIARQLENVDATAWNLAEDHLRRMNLR